MKLKFKSDEHRSDFIRSTDNGNWDWTQRILTAIDTGVDWVTREPGGGFCAVYDNLRIVESVAYFEVDQPAWLVANESGAMATTDKDVAEHFSIVNNTPMVEVPHTIVDDVLYVAITEVKMDSSIRDQINKRKMKQEIAHNAGVSVEELENLFRN